MGAGQDLGGGAVPPWPQRRTATAGKLCSKVGEDQSTNDVTILSTDAGRTPDTGRVNVILYSIGLQCIAWLWQQVLE